MGGREAAKWGRSAPPPCYSAPWGISPQGSGVFLHRLLGFISTLRPSQFDPRAYVQPTGLYKDPCTPLKHQVIQDIPLKINSSRANPSSSEFL
jgi:hypothetical protein